MPAGATVPPGLAPPPLLLLVLLGVHGLAGDVARGEPCWRAVLRCRTQPECRGAYERYARACAPVLRGDRRTCPSHCVTSLGQLNGTRGGPGLEVCECGPDAACSSAKRRLDPCLPRTLPRGTTLGCTEARTRCLDDAECALALADYLSACGRLFNGERCGPRCRAVIARMLVLPSARRMARCVCDGIERPFCEAVKANMERLCFSAEGGSGALPRPDYFREQGDGADGDLEEEDEEGEDSAYDYDHYSNAPGNRESAERSLSTTHSGHSSRLATTFPGLYLVVAPLGILVATR
uniref:growth arrest-specific protein 1-like n=1 Tax=Myxine glutinosa TaxID=7769 RepID=UPI0035902B20